MRILSISTLFITMSFLTSCSSTNKSTLMGLTIGAGLSAGAPSIYQDRTSSKERLQSTLISAGLGALAGYLIHGQLEERDQKTKRDTLLNLKKFDVPYEQEFTLPRGGNFNQ